MEAAGQLQGPSSDPEREETDHEKLVNFVRLCLIILDAVPDFLRDPFRVLISVKTNQSEELKKDWVDGEECGKWLEKVVKGVAGWVKKKIKKGEVSEWDLSTLVQLLLYSNQGLLKSTSPSYKAVDKLRDHRNTLVGHASSARTESRLLEKVVKDAKDLYDSFNVSVDAGVIAKAKEEIDRIKDETFDGNLADKMEEVLSAFQSYADQLKAFVQDSDEAHQKELEEVQALIIVLKSDLEAFLGRLTTVEAGVVDLKEWKGNAENRLDTVEADVVDLKERETEMDERVGAMEERQGVTDEKVGAMAERLKEIELQKRLDCDSTPDSQMNGSTVHGNDSLSEKNDVDGTASQRKPIAFEELNEDLEDLSAQWYSLGIHLRVDMDKLDKIQADINQQVSKVDHCFPKVLKAWKKTNPENFTKEKLVKALRAIDKNRLADRIKENAKFKMEIPSLMVALEGCKAKYFKLGIYLGVKVEEIKGFESYAGDCSRCLSTVLDEYVSEMSPKMEEVYQAVQQVGRTDIALHLKEKYKGRHFHEE